jgi:hypothetical protein
MGVFRRRRDNKSRAADPATVERDDHDTGQLREPMIGRLKLSLWLCALVAITPGCATEFGPGSHRAILTPAEEVAPVVKLLDPGTSIYWLGKGYPIEIAPGGNLWRGQTISPTWVYLDVGEPHSGMPITVVTYIDPAAVGRYHRLQGYQRLFLRTRMPDREVVEIRVPTHLDAFHNHPRFDSAYADELRGLLQPVPADVGGG